MMQRSLNPLSFLRWLARPSTLARGGWLAVAVLHVWLVGRRVALGEWGGLMDGLRGALCVAAIGYASLKFWRVATVFDAHPRRAWVFALVLLLGHWWVAPPRAESLAGPGHRSAGSLAMVILTPVAGVALALALGQSRRRRISVPKRPLFHLPIFGFARLPLPLACQAFVFFRRPPPCFA